MSKSRATEEKIIQAAMRVFASYPVGEATLRMVAQEAAVPHSLVFYHFRNKGNLYRAVLDRALLLHTVSHEPFFPILDKQRKISKAKARKTIITIVEGVVDRMYNPGVYAYQKILLFEMAFPSRHYDYMYEKHIKRYFALMVYLLQAATGIDDRERLYFHAVTILGQVVCFMQEREALTRILGMTGYSAEETAKIKEHVMKNIFKQLDLD